MTVDKMHAREKSRELRHFLQMAATFLVAMLLLGFFGFVEIALLLLPGVLVPLLTGCLRYFFEN